MNFPFWFSATLLRINQSASVNITFEDFAVTSTIEYSLLVLPFPVALYSMNITVSLQQGTGTDSDTCAIVWFSENGTAILATNRSDQLLHNPILLAIL